MSEARTREEIENDSWNRLIAAAYTAASLGGGYYVWRNWREARKDLAAVRSTGRDGDVEASAVVACRIELVRLLELGASLVVGVIATVDPRSTDRSPIKRAALSALLFAYPIGITYNARIAQEFRERFMLEQRQARAEVEGRPEVDG